MVEGGEVDVPPKYQLTVQVQATGENISLSGNFEDNDWERLKDFAEYAHELLQTKLIQDGVGASFSIHWDRDTGCEVSASLPPWDEVAVFLHKFRPIGLESESTYFYKICNILAKQLTDPLVRDMIAKQRDVYSGKRMQAQMRIQSNDIVVNSERVLFDWLNSYEYHRNKEKREFIESLHDAYSLEVLNALFLMLLRDKAEAINNIAALIRVVVGRQKSVVCYTEVTD